MKNNITLKLWLWQKCCGGESSILRQYPIVPALYIRRFRTYYTKTWHFGVLNMISWRTLRNHVCRRDILQKHVIKALYERCPPSTQRKGTSLSPRCQEEPQQTGFAVSPTLPHLVQTMFYPNTFFRELSFFVKPSIKNAQI